MLNCLFSKLSTSLLFALLLHFLCTDLNGGGRNRTGVRRRLGQVPTGLTGKWSRSEIASRQDHFGTSTVVVSFRNDGTSVTELTCSCRFLPLAGVRGKTSLPIKQRGPIDCCWLLLFGRLLPSLRPTRACHLFLVHPRRDLFTPNVVPRKMRGVPACGGIASLRVEILRSVLPIGGTWVPPDGVPPDQICKQIQG